MAAVSKAEYLKRYMSGPAAAPDAGAKKKRRKKKVAGPTKAIQGLKILDNDIDLAQVKHGYNLEDEEEPTIAEVIDERPEAIKAMEEYNASNKWKKLATDSAEDSSSSPRRRQRHDSDSDNSPPRRKRHDSDNSPPKNKQQDSDTSPPRKRRPDSDNSPPRKKRHDSDTSPPRRKRYDSDTSPPRRTRHDSDTSPPRRTRHDSDTSPPRRKKHGSDTSPPRRKRHDSDTSPPRRKRHDSDQSPPRKSGKDSGQTPPRRRAGDSDQSPPRRGTKVDSDGDISPPRQKTLSGKAAGLSSAKSMKKEIEALKMKELERFNKIGDDRLGKNAQTVFRDNKTGKKRDLKSEKDADDVKKAEWKEKYDKWAAGVVQGQAEQERVSEMVHEMSKPLARGKDDADLDSYLKDQDRDGDPMLAFMKQKKEKKNKGPKYPQYKGPAPEPNRFGIRPGYRWDGVDRGNGFERKYFQSISKKKAISAEAYKWSTEDM